MKRTNIRRNNASHTTNTAATAARSRGAAVRKGEKYEESQKNDRSKQNQSGDELLFIPFKEDDDAAKCVPARRCAIQDQYSGW